MTDGNAPASNKRLCVFLRTGFLVYAIVCSVAVDIKYRTQLDMGQQIFSLSFGFGQLARNLVEQNTYAGTHLGSEFAFTAHRMPLIPYFLSSVARFYNSLLLALLLKNIICCSLLYAAFVQVWTYLHKLSRRLLLISTIFALSCPALTLSSFYLQLEEGYITSMIFFLFVSLLFWRFNGATRLTIAAFSGGLLTLSIVNAALMLTKSSMFALSLVFCVLYSLVTRKLSVFLAFAGTLAGASLLWGFQNVSHSGVFTIGSSLDGSNLYKGNNPYTMSYYPQHSLDLLDVHGIIVPDIAVGNEWAYDAYYRRRAVDFIMSNPGEVGLLFLRKVYVCFVEFRDVPLLPQQTGFRLLVEWINRGYMLVFRLLLGLSLVYSLIWIIRPGNAARELARDRRVFSTVFFAVICVYAAPYLVGFAYQRHVLPMILPTVAFALWILQHRADPGAGIHKRARQSWPRMTTWTSTWERFIFKPRSP